MDTERTATPKVLVVDDEQEIREVLEEYLQGKGYRVNTAADGVSALKEIERERPNLVLLDVRMPGMSGLELLERIRSADPAVGVIMITANEDVELAKRTLALGAFDYISKPFDFEYLDRSVFAKLMEDLAEAETPPRRPAYRFALALFRLLDARGALGGGVLSEPLKTEMLNALMAVEDGKPSASAAPFNKLAVLLTLALDLGHISTHDHRELEQLRRDALDAR